LNISRVFVTGTMTRLLGRLRTDLPSLAPWEEENGVAFGEGLVYASSI
jgi:hypothetical protein